MAPDEVSNLFRKQAASERTGFRLLSHPPYFGVLLMEIICKKCGETKPETEFYLNRTNGREYRKAICRGCDNVDRIQRTSNPPRDPERRKKLSKIRTDIWRSNPENRPNLIVQDAKKTDKRKGLLCDLDVDWVREQISKECSYCGDTLTLMTLDRVDNSLGHVKSNLVPACSRCNYLRKDMPIEAWNFIIPSIRQARENGLFGDWNGFGIRKKSDRPADASATRLENEGS